MRAAGRELNGRVPLIRDNENGLSPTELGCQRVLNGIPIQDPQLCNQ